MAKIDFGQSPVNHTTRGLPTFQFGHPPSKMQTNFYEWVYNGQGSAILVAVAGSGKSTSIVNSLMYIEEYMFVLVLAFNKTIADEMKDKIEELEKNLGKNTHRIRAKTFHSLGFSAVCKRLNIKHDKMNLDRRKLDKLFQMRFGDEADELYGSFVTKLVSLGKGRGIGVLEPNSTINWQDIVEHHDLYLDSEDANEETAIHFAQLLLEASNQEAQKGWIDYDDQIYLPVLWRLKLWQHDFVFIDEAQDTNPVRRELAKMALKKYGRLVAVGDPGQAIYGFTGASHDAIDLIQKEFNAIKLPLTVSYRCPKAAEELVKRLVEDFSVYEGAPQGLILKLELKGALIRLEPTDAILCRNTAPLVKLAFSIIAQGRGCKVLGKDIGDGLISLINKQKAKTIDHLIEKLEHYREREVAKLLAKNEDGKADGLNDRVECIMVVINSLNENRRTVPQLLNNLETMFSDDTGGLLTLSTIHKAKGREWKRVAILEPELSPSKWARQKHQYQQEMNLIYVRDTRFKLEHITLIPTKPKPKEDKSEPTASENPAILPSS